MKTALLFALLAFPIAPLVMAHHGILVGAAVFIVGIIGLGASVATRLADKVLHKA